MLVNLPLPEKEDIINQQFNADTTHFMSFSNMMWKRVEALGILGQEKIASSKKEKKKGQLSSVFTWFWAKALWCFCVMVNAVCCYKILINCMFWEYIFRDTNNWWGRVLALDLGIIQIPHDSFYPLIIADLFLVISV